MANMTYAQFKTDYFKITGVEDDKDFLIVCTECNGNWEETNMSAGALIAARSAIARHQRILQEGRGEKALLTPYVNESLAQATKVRKSVTDETSILLSTTAAKATRGCQNAKACLLDLAHAFARNLDLTVHSNETT